MSALHAIVVDDDAALRKYVSVILEKEGMHVLAVEGLTDLLQHYQGFQPDLVILDLSLGDADGVEVLRYFSEAGCKAQIILMSSFDERLINTALRVGTSYRLNMLGTLQKPVAPQDLRGMLARIPKNLSAIRETDLQSAIEESHLFLSYQPKVELKSGRPVSAEALVRWNDPDRGIILPDQFIALAEQSCLIGPMTEFVLRRAVEECRRWLDEGRDLSVSVNLSASALTNLNLPNHIHQVLKEKSLPPDRLILEVTESTAMTDTHITMDVLTRLRIKGVSISLDDFGTGYSSLVELHRMPFSELKIDRSFVMNADKDKDARIIVEAIVGLAHTLGLKVVAEGIESRSHWDFLKNLGCDLGQGHFISEPLPSPAFRAWLGEWQPPA
ncbi:MAG: EAL domain-containing protein [Gammaproteobacteria bacterium]|nr:EAL domain-containing protein [Gammaproteobacteria bacterium]MBU1653361.1 EAL domain-containing protein [Gammaproteobacteria bacterium]MBU1962788.1 EAL domain-containing protein [Gammaproteobacteria bacterium]